MSDRCGNCDCTDRSQCVRQGSSNTADILETEKSHIATFVMDAEATEHNGKCRCGSSCTCVDCTCG